MAGVPKVHYSVHNCTPLERPLPVESSPSKTLCDIFLAPVDIAADRIQEAWGNGISGTPLTNNLLNDKY
jgi:hypothetical protein